MSLDSHACRLLLRPSNRPGGAAPRAYVIQATSGSTDVMLTGLGVSLLYALAPAVALFAASHPARAANENPPPAPKQRVATSYARVGAGVGAYYGPRNETYIGAFGGLYTNTSNAAGFSVPFELAFGAPVAENLVFGLGAYGAWVPVLERHAHPRWVGLVGPVLDWYSGTYDGFHLEVAAGLGASIIDKAHFAPAANVGLGYEWRSDEEWNVGLLARLVALTEQSPSFAPGLLLTFTHF
jgi:hypothetical protein